MQEENGKHDEKNAPPEKETIGKLVKKVILAI
jgi:hypothetical protein